MNVEVVKDENGVTVTYKEGDDVVVKKFDNVDDYVDFHFDIKNMIRRER